jgi:hypothetical protein
MNKIDSSIYNGLNLYPMDLGGWNGNSEVFGRLVSEIKPTTIIEVGSWKGQSAINMGKAVQRLGLPTKIHCVDTWLGANEFWTRLSNSTERDLILKNGYPQIYYQFLSNVVHNRLQNVILPFPNTSENGFRYFEYNNVMAEMIYIDASHEEDDVYKDITNYWNLLKTGGVMFGDDYINNWPGVVKSVNRFAEENNLIVNVLENNFWVINKN